MSKNFDVVVIGARPRRLHRRDPRRAAGLQRGLRRRVEERQGRPGPGRHLHQRRLHPVQGAAAVVGALRARRPRASPTTASRRRAWPRPAARCWRARTAVVKQNNDGILYLFKKNKVTFFHGRGSFAKAGDGGYELKVAGAGRGDLDGQAGDRRHRLQRRARCRARRSTKRTILSNDGALRIGARARQTLGVIGSGVIGLEMGSVWRRLGARGHRARRRCRPSSARSTSRSPRKPQKAFAKQGLKIELGVKVGKIDTGEQRRDRRVHRRQGRRADAGGRQADRLDRPRAEHHRPERRRGRPEAGRARLRRRRRRVQDQPAGRLGDRRRRARPDAGAQGRGRGRRGGRAHRRPARPRQLQHRAVGDLHQPRRSRGSARPSSSSRPTAARTRPARSRSWRTAARARWATPRAWSSSWPMRRPTRSWACT